MNSPLSDDDIVEHAEKEGIPITSLAKYYQSTEQTGSDIVKNRSVHTFVIHYSNIRASHIDDAVKRLYLSIQGQNAPL